MFVSVGYPVVQMYGTVSFGYPIVQMYGTMF